MNIRLLQWNIWYKEKVENILTVVKKLDPDILCLQEATINGIWNNNRDTAKWLANKMGYYYFFVPMHKFTEGNTSGNAILSRYKINRKFSILLNRPNARNIDLLEDNHTYTEVVINSNGLSFSIGTTHLSVTPNLIMTEKKQREAQALLRMLKNKRNRFVFTGDFNVRPNSYLIRQLRRMFKHCGPSLDQPTWTTKPFEYHGFKENNLRWRLDYVFATRDMKVLSPRIIKTKYSDHLPILVEFEIK